MAAAAEEAADELAAAMRATQEATEATAREAEQEAEATAQAARDADKRGEGEEGGSDDLTKQRPREGEGADESGQPAKDTKEPESSEDAPDAKGGVGAKAVVGSMLVLGVLAAVFGGIWAKQQCLNAWHDKYAELLGQSDVDAMRKVLTDKMSQISHGASLGVDVVAAIKKASDDLAACDAKDVLGGLVGDIVKPLASAAADVAGAIGAALKAMLPAIPGWVWEVVLFLVVVLVAYHGHRRFKSVFKVSESVNVGAGALTSTPFAIKPAAS